MNKTFTIIIGLTLIISGLLTGLYVTVIDTKTSRNNKIIEEINKGEAFLKQTNQFSNEKALSIFSELSALNNIEEYKFKIKYGLARSLEKNKDVLLSLEIYKELNQIPALAKDEKEKLSYSLGSLLLKLNREEEGRGHLNFVLQTSSDRLLRSSCLSSIADFYFAKQNFEGARKNYILAIQEDATNTHARIGWSKTLQKMGKDWASYEIFDDFIDPETIFDEKSKQYAKENRSNTFDKGKKYFNQKKYQLALKYFKKAINLNPSANTYELATYYIAESYFYLGKFDKSLHAVNQILGNSDSSTDQAALFRKGTIYFRKGKFKSAASIFQDVIEKFPKSKFSSKAMEWRAECLELMAEKSNLEKKNSHGNIDSSDLDNNEKEDNSSDTLDISKDSKKEKPAETVPSEDEN